MRKVLCSAALSLLAVLPSLAGAIYTINNGGTVDQQVAPYFLDPGEDVQDFYSYGHPVGSSANTGFEQSNTGIIFLTLDDNDNYGLVVILDSANDGSGGNVGLDITGMAPGTIMVQGDEPNECGAVQANGNAHCQWNWASCCTDGVAYEMGTDLDFTLTLDFTINSGISLLQFITFDPCNQGELLFINLDAAETFTITSTPIEGDMVDCNGNNQPDYCDLLNQVSMDYNNNLIPDECDIAEGLEEDCNGNMVIDWVDIEFGNSMDIDGDLIPDECETDCNGNSVPDDFEIAEGMSTDFNDNGVPDECEPDCNQNGFPDEWEIATGMAEDFNGNLIPDVCDIMDGIEPDCNGNWILDAQDIAMGYSMDVNDNMIPDECEPDCNQNGLPDEYEVQMGLCADCNQNGYPDDCDIAEGNSLDENGNGIPDECEEVASASELPAEFALAQNHPNPFNPTTTIRFALAETAQVRLSVYDMTGREVAVLVNGLAERGENNVAFDGSALASGVYFYTLQAPEGVITKKMVLIK